MARALPEAVHPEVVGSFAGPKERVTVVFDEHAQAQHVSQVRTAPTLSTAAQTSLEWFAQRSDFSAAPRGSLLFHRPVMQI